MKDRQSESDTIRPKDLGASSSWDGGWYIFEDGQVKGPLSGKDVFGPIKDLNTKQSKLVSRKGFTQWYPVNDFAEMYHMASRYTDYLAIPLSNSSDLRQPAARQIGPETMVGMPQSGDINVAQSVIRGAQKEISHADVPVVESANFIGEDTSVTAIKGDEKASSEVIPRKLTRKERKEIEAEARRSRSFLTRQAKAARKAAKAQSLIPPHSFEQQYLEVSSRLRLGKIVSPALAALIYLPLSFGGYWWGWFARVSEEVSWHLNGASRMNFILPFWMCLVPGPHLVLAYLVARMVRQIEEQNGYRTVSPGFATLLAIFPPFYLALIQTALNRHWRLHVYHSVRR